MWQIYENDTNVKEKIGIKRFIKYKPFCVREGSSKELQYCSCIIHTNYHNLLHPIRLKLDKSIRSSFYKENENQLKVEFLQKSGVSTYYVDQFIEEKIDNKKMTFNRRLSLNAHEIINKLEATKDKHYKHHEIFRACEKNSQLLKGALQEYGTVVISRDFSKKLAAFSLDNSQNMYFSTKGWSMLIQRIRFKVPIPSTIEVDCSEIIEIWSVGGGEYYDNPAEVVGWSLIKVLDLLKEEYNITAKKLVLNSDGCSSQHSVRNPGSRKPQGPFVPVPN